MDDTDLNSSEATLDPQEAETESHDDTSTPRADARENEELPEGVKERLGRQEKRHQRELRHLRAQLEAVSSRLTNPHNETEGPLNPYTGEAIERGSLEDHVHKAVNYTLHQKELQAKQEQERAHQSLVAKQFQGLHKHLDKMADKYDDFDEVVRDPDLALTSTMRDTALLLPKTGSGSAGETLYTLGKNKSELERIAKLHPIDQASELIKLSHALISGKESAPTPSTSRPMGNIKTTPVRSSHAITEKSSVGDIRKSIKAGWK